MLNFGDIHDLHHYAADSSAASFLYGLVDHAGMPGLAKKLVESTASWVSLLSASRDESTLQVAPILFRIDLAQESFSYRRLIDWVCEHGTYTSSMLFIASPLSIQELSQRLNLRLDAMLPDNMDVTLRYFDPRVFEQLMRSFTAEQKRKFLSVAHCWWFVDRRGSLQKAESVFCEDDSYVAPLSLSIGQEAELIDASEPDQVAHLVSAIAPEAYRAIPLHLQYDFILRQIDDARRISIQSTPDLAMYCVQALLHGENFASLGNWQRALQDVRSGKMNIEQAAELIETGTENLGHP